MRFIFFTFKAHIAEVELFEDFFTLIKPLILKHPQYAYCIEKDGTLDRHLHMLVGDPKYTEMKQFKQKLTAKKYQNFKAYIKQGYQTNQYAFDTQLLPDTEEDIMTVLGYIYKDNKCLRRDTTFSDEYILDSCKLYFTSEKLKYKTRKNDWRYINTKNAHSIIEMLVDKYDELNYHFLQFQTSKLLPIMWKEKISMLQLKDNQLRLVMKELHYHYEPEMQPKINADKLVGHPEYQPEEEFEQYDQNYFDSDED